MQKPQEASAFGMCQASAHGRHSLPSILCSITSGLSMPAVMRGAIMMERGREEQCRASQKNTKASERNIPVSVRRRLGQRGNSLCVGRRRGSVAAELGR